MDLPSSRELELEILLREKDAQLAEITDEISSLRRYLSKQSGPSAAERVTLPPALLSIILHHIANAESGKSASGSNTVAVALTQRARLLQEENDELYELLKRSETGSLKEEIRGLRKVVAKFEEALKESHLVISSLSAELNNAHECLRSSTRLAGSKGIGGWRNNSPQNLHDAVPIVDSTGDGSSTSRPPPTEPRAHKRPRLSKSRSQLSPPRRTPSLPQKPESYNQNPYQPPTRIDSSDLDRNFPAKRGRPGVKMEVDEEIISRPIGRERDQIRERERDNLEREREIKERNWSVHTYTSKDRDRDGGKNPHPRRNGHNMHNINPKSGAPGRKGSDRNNLNPSQFSDQGSRTLQQRLGL